MVEDPSVEDIFNLIDTNGSGKLDEKEGFEALYCLVIWGELSEDEAFAAFDHIGSFAGDDDEVDLGEMEAAVKEMEAMTDKERKDAAEGASML